MNTGLAWNGMLDVRAAPRIANFTPGKAKPDAAAMVDAIERALQAPRWTSHDLPDR